MSYRKLTENNYSRILSYDKLVLMMRFLVLTFAILSFVNSTILELDEGIHQAKSLFSSDISVVDTSINHEKDCESKDCHEDDHCKSFCSGLHNVVTIDHSIILKTPVSIKQRSSWIYDHHYLMPSLDPGLRPPINS